jgi:TonB family protein
MSAQPKSGPDPSEPPSSDRGTPGSDANEPRFETDFADLAARFSAQTVAGLSAELSADLALEIVLHEIVEQACRTTEACGAAIVLRCNGEMVCRASSGVLAPELGEHLDLSSGISAQCLQTLRTQRCDDVLADPYANIEASQRLGIRSVMVMPLLRDREVVGVFEVFSSRLNAFADRDVGTLEVLAGRVLSTLERATQPAEPPHGAPTLAPAEPVSEIPEGSPGDSAPQRFDNVTTILSAAVIACAALLVLLIGRHFVARKEIVRNQMASSVAMSQPAVTAPTSVADTHGAPAANANPVPSAAPGAAKPPVGPFVPPGGLVISENGKEIFRQPAIQKGPDSQQQRVQRAAQAKPGNIVKMSDEAAAGSLLHRVEPQYPEEGRRLGLQGAVVLDLHMAADGSVQDVQVVRGEPLLAQAASDAVKQWRFRPREVNGRPAEMQTRVTLNFKIPSQH